MWYDVGKSGKKPVVELHGWGTWVGHWVMMHIRGENDGPGFAYPLGNVEFKKKPLLP